MPGYTAALGEIDFDFTDTEKVKEILLVVFLRKHALHHQ